MENTQTKGPGCKHTEKGDTGEVGIRIPATVDRRDKPPRSINGAGQGFGYNLKQDPVPTPGQVPGQEPGVGNCFFLGVRANPSTESGLVHLDCRQS